MDTASSSSAPAPVTLLGIAGLRVHEVQERYAERVLLVDGPPESSRTRAARAPDLEVQSSQVVFAGLATVPGA